MKWTDEQETLLRALWADSSLTSTKIVKEFSAHNFITTRGAIVAKAQRLGFPSRRATYGEQKEKITKAPAAPPVKKRERKVTQLINFNKNVTIIEMTNFHCHWPVGDGKYCGKRTVGKRLPYCQEHYEMSISNRKVASDEK